MHSHDQNIRPVGVSGIILHSQMPVSQECTSSSHTRVFELATAHTDFFITDEGPSELEKHARA